MSRSPNEPSTVSSPADRSSDASSSEPSSSRGRVRVARTSPPKIQRGPNLGGVATASSSPLRCRVQAPTPRPLVTSRVASETSANSTRSEAASTLTFRPVTPATSTVCVSVCTLAAATVEKTADPIAPSTTAPPSAIVRIATTRDAPRVSGGGVAAGGVGGAGGSGVMVLMSGLLSAAFRRGVRGGRALRAPAGCRSRPVRDRASGRSR